MNLVDEFTKVTKTIGTIEAYLDSDSKDAKAMGFLLSALGQTDEELEVELEGLRITEAWLKDTLEYYVEEKGMSLEKSYKYYVKDKDENQ